MPADDSFDLSDFTTPTPPETDADYAHLCKWCSTRFDDRERAVEHVESSLGDTDHPSDIQPEGALLRIHRPNAEAAESFQNLVKQAQGGMEADPEPEPTPEPAVTADYADDPEGEVPIADLYDLLDEFREKQTENAGWYGASQRLQAFIEAHENDDN